MPRLRQDSVSLRQLLPNMVTILGLCAGLTAIRFTLLGRVDIAAALIVLAAILDGLDGLLARRLDAASPFGAEIDSLSDFVSFGVAPGLVMYQFALPDTRGLGWVFVLVYIVCACLRLARFNVDRDTPLPAETRPHFVGVPAPGAALLALLPVFLFQLGMPTLHDLPLLGGFYLGLIGLLMISRIATPSSKALRVPQDKARWVLIGAAVVAGLAITRFWLLMSMAGLCYALVISWAVWKHLRGHRP